MVITVSAYVMMAIFMFIIMKKKMSPFTALVFIPLVFALILVATGQVQDANIGTLIRQGLFGNGSKDKLTAMKGTAETGIMLLFAILYFSTMLDAGLFDPTTNKMIRFAKGDPMNCSCDVSSWCRSRNPRLLSTRYDSFSTLRNLLCCSLNG